MHFTISFPFLKYLLDNNTSFSLLMRLIAVGCISLIVSFTLYQILNGSLSKFWREDTFLRITNFSFLLLMINYLYIVFAYAIIFLKVFLEERDKFDNTIKML